MSARAKLHYADESLFRLALDAIAHVDLPVVFAMLDGSRSMTPGLLPPQLSGRYTMTIPFEPKALAFALHDYVARFRDPARRASGCSRYTDEVYEWLNSN